MPVATLLANLGRTIVVVARDGASPSALIAQEAASRIANLGARWQHGVAMVQEHEARYCTHGVAVA